MSCLRVLFVAIFIGCAIPVWGEVKSGPATDTVPRYELNVHLDSTAHHLSVEGSMVLVRHGEAPSTVRLDLAKVMEKFAVAQIEASGKAVPLTYSTEASDSSRASRFAIKLANPRAKAIKLRFAYEGTRQKGFVYSLSGPAFYACGNDTAWYPQDPDNGRGVGDMTFEVAAPLTVVATGERLAAGVSQFRVDTPQHLSFVAADYKVQRANGSIPVLGYELKDRPGFAAYIEKVADILDILQNEFGTFPHKSFAVVEVPRDEANSTGFDGASLEGIILVDSDDFDQALSIPFFGHELSHQWWGNLVTLAGTRGNAMLDEAMAQFGAMVVVERLSGSAMAAKFRREGLAGYSGTPGARGYFDIVGANLDHPLDGLPTDTFVSHEIANTKGMVVLNQLAELMGEERFRAALRAITSAYANKNISWDQLLSEIQRGSSVDLSTFEGEWFGRTGAPSFTVTYAQSGGQITISAHQPEPSFDTPLEVRLDGSGSEQKTVILQVHGQESSQTVAIGFQVKGVTVDPEYKVLHWTPAFRDEATSLARVTAAKFLENDGKHERAAATFREALANMPKPDTWGVAFLAERGLASSAQMDQDWSAVRTHSLNALQSPNRDENLVPWVYLALARVGVQMKDEALRTWAANAAVSADATLTAPTGAGVIAMKLSAQ